jgi:site-specific recombinase XerD
MQSNDPQNNRGAMDDTMLGEYLTFCREIRMLKPRTISEYRYIIGRMGKEIDYKNPGGQAEIEAAILRAKKAGNWSQSYTAKVSAGVLIPWFAFLSERNFIPFNPYIHNRFKKDRPKEPHSFTQKEFDSIIQDHRLCHQDQTILRLCWDSGVRKSELLAFDQDDFDFSENVAFVRKSKGGYSDGRCVPFTKETAWYIETQIKYVRCHGVETAVFMDYDWNRLGDSACDHRIREISNWRSPKHEQVKLHLHALRHSFANRAIAAGMEQLTVMKILGHSSLAMTNLYLHHSTIDVKNAYQKMIVS